jgi:hypothetical protein
MKTTAKIKRIILSAFTLLPIASISIVAEGKLASLESGNSIAVLQRNPMFFELGAEHDRRTHQLLSMILPPGVNQIKLLDAKKYFESMNSNRNSADLNNEFNDALRFLIENNLLNINQFAGKRGGVSY